MPALQNDTLIRALFRQPTAYTPVWLMRQAGRYLPEYNETRRRAGCFLALSKTPSPADEGTLQPLERFPLDAAILCSDILTIPDAMGLGLYFEEGEGPRFERPLRDETSIANLAAPDPSKSLRYVTDAISEVRRTLAGKVPLIGFSGSPYTLACYMVEGQASDDWHKVTLMLPQHPGLLHRLLGPNAGAALQGNLDPAVLLASPEVVRREVQKALESFGNGAGHVFNLGHGVPQFTPPENVAALVAAVRELSPKFH